MGGERERGHSRSRGETAKLNSVERFPTCMQVRTCREGEQGGGSGSAPGETVILLTSPRSIHIGTPARGGGGVQQNLTVSSGARAAGTFSTALKMVGESKSFSPA